MINLLHNRTPSTISFVGITAVLTLLTPHVQPIMGAMKENASLHEIHWDGSPATFDDYTYPLTGEPKTTLKFVEKLSLISQRCAALPNLDTRSPDEVIGYDEFGLPE